MESKNNNIDLNEESKTTIEEFEKLREQEKMSETKETILAVEYELQELKRQLEELELNLKQKQNVINNNNNNNNYYDNSNNNNNNNDDDDNNEIVEELIKQDHIADKLNKVKNFKHKGKIAIVGGLILTLLCARGMKLHKDKIYQVANDERPKITGCMVEEQNYNINFDVHKKSEIKERIAEVYAKANAVGCYVNTAEWLDWYLVSNINEISPAKYYMYIDNKKTPASIMKNYDKVNEALMNDAKEAMPNSLINLDILIADRVSSDELAYFQMLLSRYNDKPTEELANEINYYIKREFIDKNNNIVSPSVNLTRMKMLLGINELTKNKNWKIPKNEYSEIMYPQKGEVIDLLSNSCSHSIWNNEKSYVKEALRYKLEQMISISNQSEYKNFKALELEVEIEELARKMNVAKGKRTKETSEKVSEKVVVKEVVKYYEKPEVPVTTPKAPEIIITYTPSVEKQKDDDKLITPKQEKYIVENPKTKEKEIHLPASKEIVPNVNLLKEVYKENKKEQERVKEVKETAQEANDKGYFDGSNNRTYNDTSISNNNKKYYADGYNEGQKLYRGPIVIREEIIPIENIKIDTQTNNFQSFSQKQDNTSVFNYDTIENSASSIIDYGTKEEVVTNKSSGIVKTERILFDGFYEKNGELYDEKGRKLELISSKSNSQQIAALETLRNTLTNSKVQTNNDGYCKVKIG